MIRSELVQKVAAAHPDLSPREIEAIVTTFFDEIVSRLAEGGRVELRGVSFSYEHAAAPALDGIDLAVEPGLPPARADANQLEMAILNPAVNARDAMPGGGRLRIAVRLAHVDGAGKADGGAGGAPAAGPVAGSAVALPAERADWEADMSEGRSAGARSAKAGRKGAREGPSQRKKRGAAGSPHPAGTT